MLSGEGTALTFDPLNTVAESDWENPTNSASLEEIREAFLGALLPFLLLLVLLFPACFQMDTDQEEQYSQGESCVHFEQTTQFGCVSHVSPA